MRFGLAIGALLLLCGCVSASHVPSNGQALAPGVTLNLPEGPVFADGVDVTQLVQARYGDRHQMFQSYIQSRKNHFSVVMTVPSGPRIMRIEWQGDRITGAKEPIAPAALSAERTLADLMLVYASSDDLRRALVGATLVEGQAGQRDVVKDGQSVISVSRPKGDIWQGRALLKNKAFDYELSIQSERVAP